MDKVYINIHRDKLNKKYISHIYLKDNQYMIIECRDIFACLNESYKYLRYVSDMERITINKESTYINILKKEGNDYMELTMMKYKDVYNLIF